MLNITAEGATVWAKRKEQSLLGCINPNCQTRDSQDNFGQVIIIPKLHIWAKYHSLPHWKPDNEKCLVVKCFKKRHETLELLSKGHLQHLQGLSLPYQIDVHYIMQLVDLQLKFNPIIPGHWSFSVHIIISPK